MWDYIIDCHSIWKNKLKDCEKTWIHSEDGWQTDGKQTLSVSGAAAHAKEAAISVFSWVEIQWPKATAYHSYNFLIFIKNEININV